MRILLVEDSDELSDVLAKAFRNAQFSVDVVRDGEEADNALAVLDYALVILDLSLPRLDGMEVLERLRRRESKTPVLILSARARVDDRVKGLERGADDYLTKPFELKELLARAFALIRRARGHNVDGVDLGPLHLDVRTRSFTLGGTPLVLTPRERSVLEVLVLHAGEVMSKEQVLEQVGSLEDEADPSVIEIYVHRLRKKLEGSGVSIVTLRGLGYLLEHRAA